MRDFLLLLVVFGALPVAAVHPVFGIYLWTWLSVMNPHRLTWDFAFDVSFAFYTALATLIGLVVSRDRRRIPVSPPTIMLALFMIWITLGYPFAFFPQGGYDMWDKVMKIQLMTLVAAAVIVERKHVVQFIWVLVASLGFYGIKGGVFTLRGGGEHKVWGPPGTFIEGNNEVALALIVVIPLMWYLFHMSSKRWLKVGLVMAMLLTAIAAVGSYSRGAFVAIAAMSLAILWYSGRKGWVLGGLALFWPLVIFFMPKVWEDRMSSISDYELDSSAMGRINAWRMAWNLAVDRPLFGGGFDIYNPSVFGQYAPVPTDIHAAHSIYFQVLGEHGFVGLVLFLLLWWFTWRTAVWIRNHTTPAGDSSWAHNFAAMAQVSLVGYFVGGAFLSLAYFDLPYYIMVALVATKWILQREASLPLRQLQPASSVAASPPVAGTPRAPGHGA